MLSHQSNGIRTTVVKIGGSVLIDLDAYRRCAEALANRLHSGTGERLVVVVSAQFGLTDELQKLAEECCPSPPDAVLDLLWSTGELRSVALLTLHLHRLGIEAAGLNVHQCGLVARDGACEPDEIQFSMLRLRSFLAHHPAVVVPGFLARGAFDSVVSLGRGASDLTAVLLAVALGAGRCELVKDVAGYYSKDPNVYADAELLPHLSFQEALAMAAAGCDLVQTAALEAAAHHGVALLVHNLEQSSPGTLVAERNAAPLKTSRAAG